MQGEISALYIAIFIITFVISYFTEKGLIKLLNGRAAQPIYTDGPIWHTKKSGTPTMGGLAFLPPCILCLVFSIVYYAFFDKSSKVALSLIISLSFVIMHSLVGIFDDSLKLRRKDNKGLSPMEKLILQLLISLLFVMARVRFMGDTTAISFPFGSVNLGIFYYPIAIFVILGIINCANLTDGIDGLACSVACAIAISFFVIFQGTADVSILSLITAGTAVAFLFFNINPAAVFMGDTGSLLFGAMVSACSFSSGKPYLSIILGGVYVIEGISVILQVLVFKTTKKRLFKMAPLHHHLEKCGYSENKICLIAVIFTLILSVFARLL